MKIKVDDIVVIKEGHHKGKFGVVKDVDTPPIKNSNDTGKFVDVKMFGRTGVYVAPKDQVQVMELVPRKKKKRKKKTVIHVNQQHIRQNIKLPPEEKKPVITVKTYNTNEYGNVAIIYDKEGNEVARVVNGQEHPLSCGARVWIETTYPVKVEV
jgi:hypothetical protein